MSIQLFQSFPGEGALVSYQEADGTNCPSFATVVCFDLVVSHTKLRPHGLIV